MENTGSNPQISMEHMYGYASSLFETGRSFEEVRQALIGKGLDAHTAIEVASLMDTGVADARMAKAKKDMLYGGLWCLGGLVLTFAHIGYIFWGAIVFGGIQFFKGVINWNE